ncbi:hypothetical protein [Tanticharoenia sakaeratensis]|uniref:hypothetical protein n=1 Tax=Tanticharoenia sakaeratensis TaxID=444053 RepID=UPI00130E9B62|nr:hypothetical protein [Tanticharoenia sakaeratensis]GBQ20975.1 hypothetical protein AA103193_1570 [Tanticharoenia sakaeratensis NBRC 103193]
MRQVLSPHHARLKSDSHHHENVSERFTGITQNPFVIQCHLRHETEYREETAMQSGIAVKIHPDIGVQDVTVFILATPGRYMLRRRHVSVHLCIGGAR